MSEIMQLLQEQFKQNEFFQGTFLVSSLIGVGAVVWQLTKQKSVQLFKYLKRYFIFRVEIDETSSLFEAINTYFNNNYPYKLRNVIIRSQSSLDKFDYEAKTDSFVIWFKKRPVFVNRTREKLEGADYSQDLYRNYYNFSSFSKSIMTNFFSTVLEQYRKFKKEKLKPHLYVVDYSSWVKYKALPERNLDNVIGQPCLELIKDAQMFVDDKIIYKKKGAIHKRGYLLHGSPGNGKTSAVCALGQELKRDVYYLSMQDVSDSRLFTLMHQIPKGSILLLEDIDAFIKDKKRELTKSGGEKSCVGSNKSSSNFSLPMLLNILDGVLSKEDIIIVMTTNDIEAFDPALIRPGRCDKQILFEGPTQAEIDLFIQKFYGLTNFYETNIKVKSFSELQELCRSNETFHALINNYEDRTKDSNTEQT